MLKKVKYLYLKERHCSLSICEAAIECGFNNHTAASEENKGGGRFYTQSNVS